MAKPETMLVLGDIHFPYSCAESLRHIVRVAKEAKPTYIVQMGDLYDFYAFSRYARSQDHDTPQREVEKGRLLAANLWANLHKVAPKAIKYQLLGNHDARVIKRVYDRLPEAVSLLSTDHLFAFPHVTTLASDREVLELDFNGSPLTLHHGYLSKAGDHCNTFHTNTIIGHSHRAHVVYRTIRNKVLWEANAGYLGDDTQHVFKYGSTTKHSWTKGYLWVDVLGPRFVSLSGG